MRHANCPKRNSTGRGQYKKSLHLEDTLKTLRHAVLRIRDVYPGSRIRDPSFSILDPGSRVDKVPDPDPHKKIDANFSKISSGMFIPDP
jgi:hypothetical protein